MRSVFSDKLTMCAVTGGSLGMLMYFLNTTKEKRDGCGYDIDGFDIDNYDDEIFYNEETRDMDISINEPHNDIQSKDVSDIRKLSTPEELVICNIDDMVYSNLTVIIPENRNNNGDNMKYIEYEQFEEYFE